MFGKPRTHPDLNSSGKWLAQLAFVSLIALATLGPLCIVLVGSFDVSGAAEGYKFGFAGWNSVLTDPKNGQAVFYSVILSVRVPISLFIAVLVAWLLVRVKVPGRRYFEFLFWFAFFVPTVPMVTGWILLLNEYDGLLNTWLQRVGLIEEPLFNIYSVGGILWSHMSLQTIPIMVILLLPTLRVLDRSFDDAALVAGASAFTVLRKIILPLSIPSMLIVTLAAFIKALESFEVEQLLGGLGGIRVYSNQIYDLAIDSPPRLAEAMGLSTVVLLTMVVLALAFQLFQRRTMPGGSVAGGSAVPTDAYSKRTKIFGFAALFLLTTVTIILPFGLLISGSFLKLFGFYWLKDPWTTDNWLRVLQSGTFLRALSTTLLYGLFSAIIGAVLFSALAWGLQALGSRLRRFTEVLVWLPWAFPGIILGFALLQITVDTPGLSMLYGTMAPIVIALLIKELPIATHIMKLSLEQGNADRIAAARLAGAGLMTLFWRFILPLNAPALLMVFLLVFAAAVRTVDLLLLLAPANMSTLSILTFNFAVTGDFEAATVTGTIAALISLAVSLIAYRIAGRFGYFYR